MEGPTGEDGDSSDGKLLKSLKKCFVRENNKALPDSDVYDFTHARRGVALIVNNKTFHDARFSRDGSELDVIRLMKVFTVYGFDVIAYNNLTASEMVKTFKWVAALSGHKKADCFACAILSHGDEVTVSGSKASEDAIMGVDGELVPTRVLLDSFTDAKCPALMGKPRLFFIQACRGELLDSGQEILITKLKQTSTSTSVADDVTHADAKEAAVKRGGNSQPCSSTIFMDFLIMYASPPGFAAWRRVDGSWFISCLADVFLTESVESMTLTKVLTKVSKKMCLRVSSTGKKQVPCIVSSLIRDVYFTAKK